jgi:hypothetical protein
MTSETKNNEMDAKNIKEILGVVSTEIPSMIKSILSSVFSEDAGRNMGKAAAAYYSELKNGGLPEAVAVQLTQEYMRTFTSLGDMMRNMGKSGFGHGSNDDFGAHIKQRIQQKIQEKNQEAEE